jgi:hypothetical protein
MPLTTTQLKEMSYGMEMLILPRAGPKGYLKSLDNQAMRQESSRREIAHYVRKNGVA